MGQSFVYDGSKWRNINSGAAVGNTNASIQTVFGFGARGQASGSAFGYSASGYYYGAAFGRDSFGYTEGASFGSSSNGTNYGVAVGRASYGPNYSIVLQLAIWQVIQRMFLPPLLELEMCYWGMKQDIITLVQANFPTH